MNFTFSVPKEAPIDDILRCLTHLERRVMGHKMTEAGCDITVTAANDEELARFRSYVASLGFNKGLIYAPPDTSLLNGNVVTILAALKQKQLTPDEVKAYINAETRGNGRGTILKYLQGLL